MHTQTKLRSLQDFDANQLFVKYARSNAFYFLCSLQITKSSSVNSRNFEMRKQWLKLFVVKFFQSLVQMSFIVKNTRSTCDVEWGINAAYSNINDTVGCFVPNPRKNHFWWITLRDAFCVFRNTFKSFSMVFNVFFFSLHFLSERSVASAAFCIMSFWWINHSRTSCCWNSWWNCSWKANIFVYFEFCLLGLTVYHFGKKFFATL